MSKQVLKYKCQELDWLQSLKQIFINVSYHILVASLTLIRAIRVRLATSMFKEGGRSSQECPREDSFLFCFALITLEKRESWLIYFHCLLMSCDY